MKLLFILLACVYSFNSFSHPGRTTMDGCHTCLKDCESQGVPQGEEHCHNEKDKKSNVDEKVDKKNKVDDVNTEKKDPIREEVKNMKSNSK